MNKIIRTICVFSARPEQKDQQWLYSLAKRLEDKGFIIQTKRLCTSNSVDDLCNEISDESIMLSIGQKTLDYTNEHLTTLLGKRNISWNIDLTQEIISQEYVQLIWKLIEKNPTKLFNFTFTFNNVASSPYFPSAVYETNGFSIGLQPTDLTEDCHSLEEWLEHMSTVWNEICQLFQDDSDFLGIDSSIAPLFQGTSSLLNFVKRIQRNFSASVTTDMYTKVTRYIKEQNPKAIGLCGLMLPCLEDFELADEYSQGNFTIERNIYLSLHSGLGIDTYPIGVDEHPNRIIEILSLLQALSNKYKKPLSCRFISDGKAKIGDMTDFKNQYLKDIRIRSL